MGVGPAMLDVRVPDDVLWPSPPAPDEVPVGIEDNPLLVSTEDRMVVVVVVILTLPVEYRLVEYVLPEYVLLE